MGQTALEMQVVWFPIHTDYTKGQAIMAEKSGGIFILPRCFNECLSQDVSGTDKLDTQVDKEVCQGTL